MERELRAGEATSCECVRTMSRGYGGPISIFHCVRLSSRFLPRHSTSTETSFGVSFHSGSGSTPSPPRGYLPTGHERGGARRASSRFPWRECRRKEGASHCDGERRGGDENPFDAYSGPRPRTLVARPLPADFARAGWLSRHSDVRIPPLVLASKDEIRRLLSTTSETRMPRAIENHYDGSLSKADALRILDAPGGEVVRAFEAACTSTAGSANARSPLAPGGNTAGDFAARVRSLPNGGCLVTAGPFQPLWRLYRAAARLLL